MTFGGAAPYRPRAALEVGLARLHGGAPADRGRLRLQLDAVRPAALGVPERALLLVPRLVARKRLPRQGDGGLFADQVAEALRAALRRARRPGEARSADDSILFLDELDGAAVLIAQWLEGAPPAERAWWPLFTAGAAPQAWWRRHILPDARILPGLIAALARRGLAEAWLARLEPDEIGIALAALAPSCGLSPDDLPASARPPPARASTDQAPEIARAIARIHALVPEARRAALAPGARLLLLVALLAERRPALVATRAAKAAYAALARAPLSEERKPEPPRRRAPSPAIRRRTAPRAETAAAAPRPIAPEPRPLQPAPEARALRPAPDQAPFLSPPAADSPAPERATARAAEAPRPAPHASATPASAPAETDTGFGGLLFLLNALLELGLYGDFTRPGRGLPGLSPFGLLRLLGRSWFGRAFIDDPIHGLLQRLAGGRRAEPARDFEAPPWQVARDWLAPWPGAGAPLAGGHKLRPMLWHSAGFPLAHFDPADPGAAARAARRLGLRRTPRAARLPALPAPARAHWVACLRLYLEARIARALGEEDPAAAIAMLCRRPARIALAGDDVIVRFALDDHPLDIRLAGLDRDPGWIPAARRSIRYRFE